MDKFKEVHQMMKVYQKIGVIEFATAVYVVPIFVKGEVLFKVVEVKVPMMGGIVLN